MLDAMLVRLRRSPCTLQAQGMINLCNRLHALFDCSIFSAKLEICSCTFDIFATSPSIEAIIDLRTSGACVMSANVTFLNACVTLPAQLVAASYRDFSSLDLFAKSSDPAI
jgi:hypothetical protein